MGANGRRHAVSAGQRDRVVERTRAHGAGGNGVAVKRRDQGEFVAARGAVAVGERVAGLRKVVNVVACGIFVAKVLAGGAVLRGVRHGPHTRAWLGRVFEHLSSAVLKELGWS